MLPALLAAVQPQFVVLAIVLVAVSILVRTRIGVATSTSRAIVQAIPLALGLAIIPLLPVRALALATVVFVGFAVVSLVVWPLFLLWRRRQTAKMRTAITAAPPPPQVVAPADASVANDGVREALTAFEAAGFRRIAALRAEGSHDHHVLLADDGAVGEVLIGTPENGQPPVLVEVSSLLAGRRGTLATSNSELNLRLWAGELRQIFPGASTSHLVQEHRAAMEYLAAAGIRPDPLGADEVLSAREEQLARHRSAVAQLPISSVREAQKRYIRGDRGHRGRLQDDPEVVDRLASFWDAARVGDPA